MHPQNPDPQTDRRSFFKKSMAIVLGGIAGLVPLVSALVALTDPIRRKGAASPAVRVTTVDSLPPDGIPRKFPVFSSKTDAWNKFASTPVGAVYLRRTSEKNIEALN